MIRNSPRFFLFFSPLKTRKYRSRSISNAQSQWFATRRLSSTGWLSAKACCLRYLTHHPMKCASHMAGTGDDQEESETAASCQGGEMVTVKIEMQLERARECPRVLGLCLKLMSARQAIETRSARPTLKSREHFQEHPIPPPHDHTTITTLCTATP